MRVFFCKYNDPPYVKLEKLEIMIRIANEKNIDQLLMELKEYALEVDMDMVKRAVKAIGQCAIKIDAAADKCVKVLVELLGMKVAYVVQEVMVVIKVRGLMEYWSIWRRVLTTFKDIFRKYSSYESIIPTLCSAIDELDSPESRAALIWIIGEYSTKIPDSSDLLSQFLQSFNDDDPQVRLSRANGSHDGRLMSEPC